MCIRDRLILASLNNEQFIAHAHQISNAMWREDMSQLDQFAKKFGQQNTEQAQQKITLGNIRRAELKHYSGAMFFYGEEWYWGVDRFYHLENRLIDLGLAKVKINDQVEHKKLIAPRPQVSLIATNSANPLSLEIYASLRSPYSAVAFDQTVLLAKAAGLKLKVRPVLPMVCLLYTSPSPRDLSTSRMPSSA